MPFNHQIGLCMDLFAWIINTASNPVHGYKLTSMLDVHL